MSTIRKYITDDKKYLIPPSLRIVRYKRRIIVIAPEMANWIVLSNEKQLYFLSLLRSHTIGEAQRIFKGEEKDIKSVVVQIEARHFENYFSENIKENIHAHVYLTNACNLHCPHCYMSAGDKLSHELSTDEIITFLCNFHNHGGHEVVFSGGEICMRNDFQTLIRSAYDQHLFVRVLTNGTMWSQSAVENISPYIGEIQVSIDGYCEEENQKVRGNNSFHKALLTVDEFIKHDVPTRVAITPIYNSELKTKIPEYVNFVQFLIDKYTDKPFRVVLARELLDGRNVKLTSRQKKEYQRIMSRINEECFGKHMYIDFINARREGRLTRNCSYGDITLSANGDVYFCNRLPVNSFRANIRTKSFEDIWEMSQYIKKISDVNNLEPCSTCELKFICGGGCRIEKVSDLLDVGEAKLSINRLYCSCSLEYKRALYDQLINLNELIFH